MASSSPVVHPARYLALFLTLLIGVFLLVFLTGDKQAKPKLGIDLQGGTRVTLTARTPDGSPPSREALDQAQQIIGARVNGLGVSGSEVVVDGDQLVITVPGSDGSQARDLGQTAKLYIRPVLEDPIPFEQLLGTQQPAVPPIDPNAPLPPPVDVPAAPAGAPPAGQPSPGDLPAPPPPQPRPYPQEPTPPPSPPAPGSRDAQKAEIERAKVFRQSGDQLTIYQGAIELAQAQCQGKDPLAGNDDPALPLITCNQERTAIYVLGPSIISGEEIDSANASLDQQQNQWVVDVKFKSAAADTWANYTAAHVGEATAFVLDSQVVSAPTIQTAITGPTQITGQFNSTDARELANVLKYGSLPLSFEASEAQTVSATLGLTSLRAGLIAGAIGLALVLVYALLYYRVLGLLTALSLVASGAIVYALLILLGRYINYTLDLAGIAGLIIGIGTTADSFVVFFERIKDEIREGRSFRSAVPRGWARARKTILSGNAVSFLAAAVLYFLAIGQVRGFAFTLGLTTILDVVVVFLVTWPLVYLASKSTLLAKARYNGLGAVQQIARERRAATAGTARG